MNKPSCCSNGWYAKNVPTGHSDFGRLFLCTCPKGQAIKRQRLENVTGKSQMPPDYQIMTFANFYPQKAVKLQFPDPTDKTLEAKRIRRRIHALNGISLTGNVKRAKDKALAFAKEPHYFFTLMGEPGCGKTHLAAAIAHHCMAQGRMVIFAVIPDLLDRLKATFDKDSPVRYDDLMQIYLTVELLILDDMGSENETPWANEKLYQIVNYRYNWQLPTVVTTNDVPPHIDLRLQSRLFDARNVKFEILAGDYRPIIKRKRAT